MRREKTLPSLAMLVLILMALPAADAGAATIKLSDYWFSRGLGDSWTYGYSPPSGVPDFTVAITLINEGVYSGKYRMGDYRDPDGTAYYQIVSFDTNFLYLYYDKGERPLTRPPQFRLPRNWKRWCPTPPTPTLASGILKDCPS